MRNWFAGRDVDAFSIAVWIRREIGGKSKANIVSNGECELPSFHITTQNETLYGGITTDQNITLDGAAVTVLQVLICCLEGLELPKLHSMAILVLTADSQSR